MKTQQIRKLRAAGLAVIVAITLFSCGGDRIEANSDIITERRDVTGFDDIEAGGANNIHVSYGEQFKVEVKGSSNLIPAFETKVEDKTLKLGYRGDVDVKDDDVEVFVTLPVLNGLSLSGSGNMDLRGSFPESEEFIVDISGSGNIDLKEGFKCVLLDIEISGSGKADLSDLQAVRSNVEISGSGDAYVRVDEKLDVRINGSGTVYYRGTPRVKSDINGSGQVTRL